MQKTCAKLDFRYPHKTIWIESMVGMSIGFFATLIIGSLFSLIGLYSKDNLFLDIDKGTKMICPLGIGIGVAYRLKLKLPELLGLSVASFLASKSLLIPAFSSVTGTLDFTSVRIGLNLGIGYIGDVFAAWISAVMLVYFYQTIKHFKTSFNFILIPLFGILLGLLNIFYLTYLTTLVLVLLQALIYYMSIQSFALRVSFSPLIGLLMGLALTLPISSVAIAFALKLEGAAALMGTTAQMISFGILTYHANRSWSKTLAVAFGTSMLHMPNYARRPVILIIPALASALAAIVAVGIFDDSFNFNGISASTGMGSSLLVYAPVYLLQNNSWGDYRIYLLIIGLGFGLSALITYGLIYPFEKRQWLKKEWLQLTWEN